MLDNTQKVKFTKQDQLILDSYKSTMDGLADYLGDGYEFVLHSLEDLEHSVVKIINGHYTGRKEGSSITDLALAMLAKIEEQSSSDYISYFGRNKKDEPLKSTTIAIRGSRNKVIGLLCINFYLNTPLKLILDAMTPPGDSRKDSVAESFAESVDDLIEQAIRDAKLRVLGNPQITPVNRNKEIINELQQRGIFNLKDSVAKVADHMQLSKNTVYLHVRNLGG